MQDVGRGDGRHRDEWGLEFSRIVAFSDGVFAIAITLLVLAIELPENAPDLHGVLETQVPDLFAYFLSFAVLGNFWLSHHRFFGHLARFDGRLMVLNLAYLAAVALVPFSTEALGDYGDEPAAVIVYAANIAAIGLVNSVQLKHCLDADLFLPDRRDYLARYGVLPSLLPSALFLISIPVALVSPVAAIAMWVLLFVLYAGPVRRLIGRLTARKAERKAPSR